MSEGLKNVQEAFIRLSRQVDDVRAQIGLLRWMWEEESDDSD